MRTSHPVNILYYAYKTIRKRYFEPALASSNIIP